MLAGRLAAQKTRPIVISALYFQVSYHRFPSDVGLKKKWIAAIKRDEGPLFRVSKATKVCSLHFLATDFCTNVASGHRLLLESAVPSIFPFTKTKPPIKLPRQRASSTIPAPKPKKRVHAQEDGQPPSTSNVESCSALLMRTSFRYKRLS